MNKRFFPAAVAAVVLAAAAVVSPVGPESVSPASAVTSSDWTTLLPIIQRNTSVLTAPPTLTPGISVNSDNNPVPDGAFMGNGHVTAAIGGTAAAQSYLLTTTDFFNNGWPSMVGSVTINTPGLTDAASFRQEQDPGLAEVRSTFTQGTVGLKVRSFVAATADTVVLQLTNTGTSAINGMTIVTKPGSFGTNDDLPVTNGVDVATGTAWVTRTTEVVGSPWVSRAALATRVVGSSSTVAVTSGPANVTSLSVPAGATVNVVVGVAGGRDLTTHLADARNNAQSQTAATIAALVTSHRNWWKTFWTSGATVDVGGGVVEQYWYTSLYMLASANRTGQNMPGMQMIQTQDKNQWEGGWWTNYNIENPYLGVYSSNHPELTDPYDTAINDFLPTAYSWAVAPTCVNGSDLSGSKGALMPTIMGPAGQNTGCLDHGMKGNAAWLATVMVNHWNYTRDAAWASSKAYPWLRATARYWDQNLVKDANGIYNVVGSAQNEFSTYTRNGSGDLAFLRGLYAALIDMNAAGAVTSSAAELTLWNAELANLAPLPTFASGGKTLFKATEDAPGFYGGDANPVNGATFAPVLGLGSSAATLQTLRDTIYELGSSYNGDIWYQSNSFAWVYPAAARAGLPDVFSRMTATLGGRPGKPTFMRANGTVSLFGGGAESVGSVETVNGMLLSSYDGVLRMFPAWTFGQAASFSNMGAVGGFSVSSSMTNSGPQGTTVLSKKGQSLKVAPPWAGATVSIVDAAGGTAVTGTSATVTAPTIAGHTYNVTFSGGTMPKVNLAPKATASVSSDIASTEWWAGYANDGQTTSQTSTTGWSSSANLGADHQEYFQLDFGTATTFTQVALSPRSDAGNLGQGFPSNYSVAVSNDGANWTTVATGSAAAAPTSVVSVNFSAQTARYVRVTGLNLRANPNDYNQYRMQFAEVSVFNGSSLPVGTNLQLTSQDGYARLQGTGNAYAGSATVRNVAGRTTPDNPEMRWSIADAGNGYVKITNITGLVLTGTSDGYQGRTDVMNVVEAPAATTDTQLWKPVIETGQFYRLVNKASGLSLWLTGNLYLGLANTYNIVQVPAGWSGPQLTWSIAP
jgi:F5/8 type C domain/Ricin-type beta-trefoil lectin domain-like